MVDEDGEVVTVRGLSVAKLRDQYNDFDGAKRNEIEEMRVARHYYHGDQWTKEEIAVLKARRQPVVTSNRIARKINGITGLVDRTRQDPKAYPRTPKQQQGADIATETLRYAFDRVDWPTVSSEVARNAAINGVGVVEMFLEEGDQQDQEVGLMPVEADSFFYDPRSYRADFSDARFMGVVKWLALEDAVEMFPDKEAELRNLLATGGWPESNQQQDRENSWVNTTAKQVRVIEHWYQRSGEWQWCFYSGEVELARGLSEFVDERKRTICKFIAFSANVDHDGDRYGFVRNLKSPQDEINARRSKALHQVNTRRIIARKGEVEDVEKARKEWARPDGWIEVNDLSQIQPDDASRQADLAAQLQFLEESKAEIENMGFNPALIGTGVKDMSGRAIQLQQQAGIAELGPYILAYRGWKLRVYRAVWNAIQQFWTAERWIRVTDDMGMAQFIQVNGLQMDAYGMPSMVNALGSLDVDVILDEGPDTITIQQSNEQALAALAQNGVPVPPQAIIKMTDMPAKDKAEILAFFDQQQKGDPNQAQKDALEMENAKAEVGKTKAEALDKFASASQKFAQAFAPQPLPGEYGGDGSMPQGGQMPQPGGPPPMTMPPAPAQQPAPLPF